MRRTNQPAFLHDVLFLLAFALIVPANSLAHGSGARFDVRHYGAVGDGKTVETASIIKTIKACNEAGGGTVLFPAGEYVTGTFELLSNVTLELESGAVIKGSNTLADYKLKSDYNLKGFRSGESGEGLRAGLIVANKARNIAITGHGVIDGNGTYFVDPKTPHYGAPPDFDKLRTRQGEDFMSPKFGTSEGPASPWMDWKDRPGALIILAECDNLVVKDITIKDSHNWTLNVSDCENVEIRGINILNNPIIPNNDGINITARHARISDCNIWTGDDAIAANECENLTVTNCVLSSRSSAIRFTGGRYCTFQNLVFRDSNRGIGIYGAAQNVLFSDILIETRLFTGHWWGKAEPIYISARLNRSAVENARIRNVRFSNIMAECENGILIYGTENSLIRDILFDRVALRVRKGLHTDAVGGNFDLRGLGAGLEFAIFKHDIPGMYCQYVENLQIHGLKIEWADSLPDYYSDGIYCEHFSGLRIDGFTGRQAQSSGSGAAITLKHGTGASLVNCIAAPGTRAFLSLEDVKDQRLFINNDLGNASQQKTPAEFQFRMSSGNLLGKEDSPPGKRQE
jgi:hypothetical protein